MVEPRFENKSFMQAHDISTTSNSVLSKGLLSVRRLDEQMKGLLQVGSTMSPGSAVEIPGAAGWVSLRQVGKHDAAVLCKVLMMGKFSSMPGT